jgi:threonine dehydrogenase-like Zn-dependent dehydrogenase
VVDDAGGCEVEFEAALVSLADVRAVRNESRSGHSTAIGHFPHVLGFSAIGRVVGGCESDGRTIPDGTRVVVSGVEACGCCRWCEAGQQNRCLDARLAGIDVPGLWSERIHVAPARLYEIADGVDIELACLVSELATAVRVVRRGQVEGQRVAVLGAGAHGRHAIQVARALGAVEMVAVDPNEPAREAAILCGATRARTPEDMRSALAAGEEEPPGVVIEFTSAAGSLNDAVEFVAHGGRVVAAGTPDEPAPKIGRYYATLITKEVNLVGAYAKGAEDWTGAIKLLEDGAISAPADARTISLSDPGTGPTLVSLSRDWVTDHRVYLVPPSG